MILKIRRIFAGCVCHFESINWLRNVYKITLMRLNLRKFLRVKHAIWKKILNTAITIIFVIYICTHTRDF